MNIGILEDHDGIAEMLAAMLSIAGEHYTSERFATAQEAMRSVLDAQQNNQPSFDMMLVDLMLPGSIDGAEFISRVRAALPNTPTRFILMTGSGICYDALMRKHLLDIPLLSKPFKLDALMQLLGKEQIQSHSQSPSLPAPETAGTTQTASAEQQAQPGENRVVAPEKQTIKHPAPVAPAVLPRKRH